MKLTELEGWDELEELANQDNVPSQNKIKVQTAKKNVYATVNLSNSVFSMQKVIGHRLEELTKQLHESSKAADVHSKRMFWLTIALVVATIVQAISALIVAKK